MTCCAVERTRVPAAFLLLWCNTTAEAAYRGFVWIHGSRGSESITNTQGAQLQQAGRHALEQQLRAHISIHKQQAESTNLLPSDTFSPNNHQLETKNSNAQGLRGTAHSKYNVQSLISVAHKWRERTFWKLSCDLHEYAMAHTCLHLTHTQ